MGGAQHDTVLRKRVFAEAVEGAEMAPLNEESEDDETFYEGQIDETIFDENCAVLLGF
ncbi:hypothetical protein GCM10020255_020140 [Rhodococcus baikonurensis]